MYVNCIYNSSLVTTYDYVPKTYRISNDDFNEGHVNVLFKQIVRR